MRTKRFGHREILFHPNEILVRFSPTQQDEILWIATARQAAKEAHKDELSDNRIKDRDDIETHRIGVMGEAAVAKLFGLRVSREVGLSGNHVVDLWIGDVGAEIKTYLGWLTLEALEDFKAEVIALVCHETGVWSRAWVQGWTDIVLFTDRMFAGEVGHGDRLCVQPVDLRDIRELGTILRRYGEP